MLFTDKVYDVMKWIAMYFLPAAGTLYFAISSIWGLPYGEQVLGTIAAVDTFLAAILGISTATMNYIDDQIEEEEKEKEESTNKETECKD